MKPKRIRTTVNSLNYVENGEIIDVIKWNEAGEPYGKPKRRQARYFYDGEWEPVIEFKNGDLVWAWDSDKRLKVKGFYVGISKRNEVPYPHIVESEKCDLVKYYANVELPKPQITIQELAKRADINLDEYEIIK